MGKEGLVHAPQAESESQELAHTQRYAFSRNCSKLLSPPSHCTPFRPA